MGGCLSYWDAWLLFLLMLVTGAIPLRIGFDLPLSTAWLVCDIVTDVTFITVGYDGRPFPFASRLLVLT